jgi:hypothetical protein
MALNPDVNQSHKDLLTMYKADLKKLNRKIENNTASAADILNGINLCRETIDNLDAGSALPKNKRPFSLYKVQLLRSMNKAFPHLNVQ